MEAKKTDKGVLYGSIAALSMILFTIVLYFGGIKLYLSGFAYLGYAILISLAALAALAQKKANGGWLEFQAALKTSFTVFVLALAAQTLFTWLLLNIIDTHFKNALTQAIFEKTEAVMKKFGLSDDQMERAMTSERSKDQFSLSRMILGLAFNCIVHFIIALLIAAIVKKKKNESAETGF